ncbi:hypothetical protein LMG23992_02241 [Cupriavidus laharis]|uniref:Chromosome partition protein Smc n=1 Tax=Cupriavidus laharis TaxID=151654 RepID=A0ABM8WY23_9BURK|nr:hypothetical protein [Cupriavidus laharis]CAG9172464.1 hypothetical protein LMG23992_02241 [Cupriavidus laharis]
MATDSDDVVELTALLNRVMGEPLAPLRVQADLLQERISKQHSETSKKLNALDGSLDEAHQKMDGLERQINGLKSDLARENGKLSESLDRLHTTSETQQADLLAQLGDLRATSETRQTDLMTQFGSLCATSGTRQAELLAQLDALCTAADSRQADLLAQLGDLRATVDARQTDLLARFDTLRGTSDSQQKGLMARFDAVDRLSVAVDDLGLLQRQQAVTGRDTLTAVQSLLALADRLRAHVGQLDAAIVGQVDTHVERRLSEIRASMQSALETTSAATHGRMRGQWYWLLAIGLLNLAGVAGVAALFLSR